MENHRASVGGDSGTSLVKHIISDTNLVKKKNKFPFEQARMVRLVLKLLEKLMLNLLDEIAKHKSRLYRFCLPQTLH